MKSFGEWLSKNRRELLIGLAGGVLLVGLLWGGYLLMESTKSEHNQEAIDLLEDAKQNSSEKLYTEALDKLNKAYQLDASNADILAETAYIYMNKKQYKLASEVIEKGLHIDGNHNDLLDSQLMLYFSQLEFDKATQTADLLWNKTENEKYLFYKAKAFLAQNDSEQARASLALISDTGKRMPAASIMRVLAAEIPNLEQAKAEWDLLQSLDKEEIEDASDYLPDVTAAASNWQKSYALVMDNPDEKAVYSTTVNAQIAYDLGFYQLANSMLTYALQEYSDYADALLLLSQVQAALEENDNAITTLNNVAQIEPDNYRVWWIKASIYNKQKDQDQADSSYQQAIKLSKNNNLDLVAEYAQKLQEWGVDSEQYWELILKQKKVDKDILLAAYQSRLNIHINKAEWEAGQTLINKGNLDSRWGKYLQEEESGVPGAKWLCSQAHFNLSQEKYQEAEALLEDAKNLNDESPCIYYYQGQIAEANKNTQKAYDFYLRLLDLDTSGDWVAMLPEDWEVKAKK